MLLPRVVSFRCKSESLQQQRKFALRAGSFRARTGRDVNYCDRCADFETLISKGGVYSPRSATITAVCVVIIVLDRMAVGYHV